MEKRYIFIEPNGDISRWEYHDLENQPDIDVLLKPAEIENNILKILKRIHFSRKLNKMIPLPFKNIWNSFYTLEKYEFRSDTEYYIIVGNFAITEIYLGYLEKIRRKYGAKIVLYFTDPICSEYALYAFETTKKFPYDYVYTFDKADAEKYGFLHTGPIYSAGEVEKREETRDIYYIGVNKNRLPLIRKVYNRLTPYGITCDFYVAAVDEDDIQDDGIHYNKRCSYPEVVQNLQSYGTLLEINQEGQVGATLRYYEAVVHDKKLITNNPMIKDYPCYHPENMLIIESAEDIDPEWVKKPCVPYHYNGEFTPLNWIHRIGTEKFTAL